MIAKLVHTQIKEIKMKKLVLVLMMGLVAGNAVAHSGGTDAQGCHENKKTGVYHCH